MWRMLRIALLLLVLVAVVGEAWLDRTTTRDWTEPLWVGVYPVNADDSAASDRYIETLQAASFQDVEQFFTDEGHEYAIGIDRPVHVELYRRLARRPPLLAPQAGWFSTALWSLRMRWYAWRASSDPGRAPPNIRLFVLYHAPERAAALPHSLGLSKGLMGIVHVYAERAQQGPNNVVLAHELLHTLGATDKYDPGTLLPSYPEGYAEPDRQPRYPQPLAEIMAGRRAISARAAEMPASLAEVVVGPKTAREIAWRER